MESVLSHKGAATALQSREPVILSTDAALRLTYKRGLSPNLHFERITLKANGIALTVEEAPAGQFYWVLQQQQRLRTWRAAAPVERAMRPMPSYGLAVMAGTAALEKRAGVVLHREIQKVLEQGGTDFGPTTIAGTLS